LEQHWYVDALSDANRVGSTLLTYELQVATTLHHIPCHSRQTEEWLRPEIIYHLWCQGR
jgi:hypothetical protein